VRWFITRKGVIAAAVLTAVSIGVAGLSSLLPKALGDLLAAAFLLFVFAMVIAAARAQSRRWRSEWESADGDR
jgi:hypothetical protein